jgi:hypothetical protein
MDLKSYVREKMEWNGINWIRIGCANIGLKISVSK